MRIAKWILAVVLVLWVAGSASAGVIYATGGNGSDLVTINTATGAGTTIGPSGAFGAFSAAWHPNGTLYGIQNWSSSTNRLVTYNTATGAVTPVGGTFGVPFMLALEISSSGTIYGGSWGSTNNFFTINPATGAPTVVGSTGFDGVMDFAFDGAGTLYAVNNFDLWTINTTTGAGTHVAALSGIDGPVMGIMFDENGVLFATTYIANSSLYTINTTTGAATFVGSTGLFAAHGGDIQIAAIPEPASIALAGMISLGLAGYCFRRRRKCVPQEARSV